MAIPSFVDRVKLTVQAGNGGHGCTSIHREKFVPLGGPDGGNGGDGGSIIFRVDDSLSTLVEYHRQSVRKAVNGQPGKGDHQDGSRGDNVVLAVPSGTVISDAETGEVLADLTEPGADLAIALASASAYRDKAFPVTLAAVGEISLAGEIRPASSAKQRLAEAKRLGFSQVLDSETVHLREALRLAFAGSTVERIDVPEF